MTTDEPLSYIALDACGCLMGACVDDPSHKRDTAKYLAQWVRWGATIQRVTTQHVREMEWKCATHKVKKDRLL